MIKRFICIFAITTLALTACKREAAAEKIDDSSVSIPPADPNAVATPEPNISAGPAEKTNTPPPPPVDGKYPEMAFASKDHDFGKINEGDKVTYSFSFENTGKADLIISDAKGSCGCTVPEYPKAPLKPGESGKIKVSFNSAGKHGMQHKTVTLKTNTAKGNEVLNITAEINGNAGSK
ncbi:MAG: DUF1573 domain-containing protein [Flavobacterium sp.]|nr:MAG: DUF1573 domain-containing protein [Flavobacterium sp.]